jgi:hypothetical protein
MRFINALFNSNPFWGVIALIFLAIGGAWKGDVVKALALSVAWAAGVYALYGFWGSQSVQDWRVLVSLALIYTGAILLLYYSVDPHRPVSRPIIGEPLGRGTDPPQGCIYFSKILLS